MSNKRIIAFRRKREGKTNYHKRLSILKSKKVRLVIRKTTNHIIAQFIEYQPKGDKIIAHATSTDIKKMGWKYETKNIPCAYLVGYLLGKKGAQNKIKEAIVDFGNHRSIHKNRLFAVVKGVLDSGIKLPVTDEIFPSEDRIQGKHIVDFGNKLKENEEQFQKQFSKYIKENVDYSQMPNVVNDIKNKITG